MGKSMVGLLLLLAALSLAISGIAGMALLGPSTYTADDNGKTVGVNVGDTFWIKLPENPTTGYAWDLKLSEGLTKLSDRYEPADRSGLKVGVGGDHYYEIKAMKQGPQQVTGDYLQAGNQSPGALASYALNVNVTEGGPLSWLFHMPATLAGQRATVSAAVPLKISNSLKGIALPSIDKLTIPIISSGTSAPPLPAASNQRSPQNIRVTHTDVPPAEAITANVGDTITLQLPENPSTGYSWQMTWSDGLEKVDDSYIGGNTGSIAHPIVGAGGTHEWTFRVTKSGAQRISGVYKRPWEGASAGEKSYALAVNVA